MKYTKEHEWANLEGDTATVGITDYAANQLGDVVFVEMPGVGDSVGKGDTIGTIESVKTVSDLYSPLTGEIVAVNEEIESNPGLVNEDPHGKGWLIKIKLSDPKEMDDLLSEADYKAICE
ncbi:MAG: glycine cleavage system protein [Clostridiales bacterium]|jgi:glycine cleavage system H protein|nr:glycine cleavage system protein [Clostridiales bacterium]MDN5281214.1 glycine cleavage system protein [Candidatus Ozemobacter sp.]